MRDELIRFDEIQRLGVCKARQTLTKLMAERGFPAPVQLNTRNRFWRRRDVEAWIQAQQTGIATPPQPPASSHTLRALADQALREVPQLHVFNKNELEQFLVAVLPGIAALVQRGRPELEPHEAVEAAHQFCRLVQQRLQAGRALPAKTKHLGAVAAKRPRPVLRNYGGGNGKAK